MKAYKGFTKNLKCRNFQYEIGGEYEEEEAELCKNGFHACEYPLDCFNYYRPADSRFCEVDVCDVSTLKSLKSNDTKICGRKIKIGAEIGIPGFVKAAIEYVSEKADPSNKNHTTANQKSNSATGNWSANSATGYKSANSATGYKSANSATGNWSANSTTGYGSANSATGNWSANSTTGYGSANLSTGENCTNNGAGQRNISIGWGKDNKCKGLIGSFLVLSEWEEWDGEKYPFKNAAMVEVDGEKIKEDTYYMLVNGEIVEVEG